MNLKFSKLSVCARDFPGRCYSCKAQRIDPPSPWWPRKSWTFRLSRQCCGVKLDLDLVRELLTIVEDSPAEAGMMRFETNPEAEAATCREIAHLALLIDHGWLEGNWHSDTLMRPCVAIVHRLSMSGHEFLGQVRNSTVWEKLKNKASENGGSMTLAVAQSLAEKLTAQWLGLRD